MPEAVYNVRMDTALMKKFDLLCNDFGMTVATAFNIFAKTVVRERRIPFEISSNVNTEYTVQDFQNAFMALRKEAQDNGVQGMPLEEINAEITQVRTERAERIVPTPKS